MAKNMPDHRARLSRHSHDVSAGFTSTIAPGMIVPQYFDVLGVGDTIYYKNIAFARLRDIVTAFLGEVDVHFDAFFVPLQMMYTQFGNTFFGINEPLTDFTPLQPSNLKASKYPVLNVSESILQARDSYQLYQGFECWGKSVTRLMDALDMNRYAALNNVQAAAEEYEGGTVYPVAKLAHSPNVSPWIVAAYQAIYQKYYRNDNIERFDITSYNFDSHWNDDAPFVNPTMLLLRYVQRPADYFTSFQVSPIASAINGSASSSEERPIDGGNMDNISYLVRVNNWLGGNSNQLNLTDYAGNQVQTGSDVTQILDSNSDNLTANLRAMFAVEKYMRIWGRADKTYDDQVLAHFGYKVPHDIKHQITHLKHNKMVIQSDPVYASGSEDYALGQVGGQASGSLTGEGDKFTAPVHGVFMIVAYVVTKPRYQDTFNKLHMLSDRIDFPQPEFDKLGCQPLFGFETTSLFMQDDTTSSEYRNGFRYTSRLGWQYRYQQFKKKYNRISLAFGHVKYPTIPDYVNPYQPWVLSRSPFDFTRIEDGTQVGGFEDYGLSVYELYESPMSLNDVMVTPYSPLWSNDYFANPNMMFDTDPIILEYLCDCKKVSWMSETGEPDL